jgi:hypothetical protein
MKDFRNNGLNHINDYYIEENNIQIGQEEEDFESAFNQIFVQKKDNIMHETQEDYNDIEKFFYLKNDEKYIKKDEYKQISQKNNFLSYYQKKILSSNEDFIYKDKENKTNYIYDKNSNSNIEHVDGYVDINIPKEKKLESYNIIASGDTDKPNKFRAYSLNDFNVFHPGGNIEYYKQIKEEINEQVFNQLEEDNNKSSINPSKFKIYKARNKKNKKKPKEKRKRKDKPDDVRKKIKARFLKTTKNRINQMLKIAKSKEFFDLLPQCFICNISKLKNKPIIDMKFKELMSQKFYEDDEKKKDKIFLNKKTNPDKKKYENNVKVLKYLEDNYEICRKSNFNVIGNMTFKDLFKEYLKSEEFEKEIEKLKDEKNNDNYIKDYIIKAYGFINYFSKTE